MSDEIQTTWKRAEYFRNYFAGQPYEYVESEFEEGLKLSELWLKAMDHFAHHDPQFDAVKSELKKAAENCSSRSVRLIDLGLQASAWLRSIEER
jgi:hypothetical protein